MDNQLIFFYMGALDHMFEAAVAAFFLEI
jgi:hypothetical protein